MAKAPVPALPNLHHTAIAPPPPTVLPQSSPRSKTLNENKRQVSQPLNEYKRQRSQTLIPGAASASSGDQHVLQDDLQETRDRARQATYVK